MTFTYALVVGAILPFLVAAIAKTTWSSQRKRIFTILLAVLATAPAHADPRADVEAAHVDAVLVPEVQEFDRCDHAPPRQLVIECEVGFPH